MAWVRLMKVSSVLIVFVALQACNPSTPTNEFESPAAIVYGTVLTLSSSPVVGARLRIVAYDAACSGPPLEPWTATTDSGGQYRLQLLAGGMAPESRCISMTATRSLQGDSVTVNGTLLAFRAESSHAYDSARVDIRFP
jgi:hypothetical protein